MASDMKLNTEHIEIGPRMEHTRYQQLREFDHRPEYQDVRVVPSESSDAAHLVARVSTLPEPFDPDTTDEVEDRIDVIICSCSDHWFRRSGGFENGENPPQEWGKCKHAQAFRAIKAQEDDEQTQLHK